MSEEYNTDRGYHVCIFDFNLNIPVFRAEWVKGGLEASGDINIELNNPNYAEKTADIMCETLEKSKPEFARRENVQTDRIIDAYRR